MRKIIEQKVRWWKNPERKYGIYILLLLNVYFAGCTEGIELKKKNRISLVRSKITYVSEFLGLFKESDLIFSHVFPGSNLPVHLDLKTGLYGRYTLHMRIPVYFNADETEIIKYEDPEIFIFEIEDILYLEDGRVAMKYGKSQFQLGKKEWSEIVKAKGDLSVAGIKIEKNRPVRGFEENWRKG